MGNGLWTGAVLVFLGATAAAPPSAVTPKSLSFTQPLTMTGVPESPGQAVKPKTLSFAQPLTMTGVPEGPGQAVRPKSLAFTQPLTMTGAPCQNGAKSC